MKNKIGRFELFESLDGTPNGRVYAAVEHVGHGLTRPAIVKFLRLAADSPDARSKLEARLERETRFLVQLAGEPNIANMLDSGIDEELGPWIAFERLDHSVKEAISDTPAEPSLVRKVLTDSLMALAALHRQHPPIIHRDVKPANVLCTEGGAWKLTDFGLATAREEDATLDLVTVQYCAPELLDRQLGSAAPPTDLYSLGMTAYHLALGEEKFRPQFPSVYHDDLAQWDEDNADTWPKWMFWHCSTDQEAKPVAEIIPGFPKDLSNAIQLMMRKPMDQRAQTAEQVLAVLEGFALPTPTSSPRPKAGAARAPKRPDEKQEKKLSPLAIGLAAVLGLLILGGGAFAALVALTGGGPEMQIIIDSPSPIEDHDNSLALAGHVVGFPQGGSLRLNRKDTSARVPVTVNSDGTFSVNVDLPRVDSFALQLALADASGQILTTKEFTATRLLPEFVQLTIQTSPAIFDAEVKFRDPDNGEEIATGATNEEGRYEARVPYGSVEVEVRHPRYRTLRSTMETEKELRRTVTARLAPLTEPVLFNIVPAMPSLKVVDRFLETGEEREVLLDDSGRADENLALGTHLITVTADGYVPQRVTFEVEQGKRPPFRVTMRREGAPEEGEGNAEPTRDEAWLQALEQMLGRDPTAIWRLPLEDLRAYVEHYALHDGLTITEVPLEGLVRISGTVLSQSEYDTLIRRVGVVISRLQMEVGIDASVIVSDVRSAIIDAGESQPVVRVVRRGTEQMLDITLPAGTEMTAEEAEAIAQRYVFRDDLVRVRVR